jgi:cytochrome P450 family 4
MTYLERFIKESLRLFPVASAIGRFVTDDVALGISDSSLKILADSNFLQRITYILPRGTTVIIPILHLHRDPDFWPDPLTFNPDRFLTEEVSKRHPYEYLPFSGGHRNCIGDYSNKIRPTDKTIFIGIRYAMLEMKTVLSTLLRHYRVVATTHTSISDIKLKLDIATKCVGGQKIQLEVRS